MKNALLVLGLTLFSAAAMAEYSGNVVMVCDTAKDHAAVAVSARSIEVKNNIAYLYNFKKNPNGSDDLVVTSTVDLKNTVRCSYEPEVVYQLQ